MANNTDDIVLTGLVVCRDNCDGCCVLHCCHASHTSVHMNSARGYGVAAVDMYTQLVRHGSLNNVGAAPPVGPSAAAAAVSLLLIRYHHPPCPLFIYSLCVSVCCYRMRVCGADTPFVLVLELLLLLQRSCSTQCLLLLFCSVSFCCIVAGVWRGHALPMVLLPPPVLCCWVYTCPASVVAA
jgi:hypothetical protein